MTHNSYTYICVCIYNLFAATAANMYRCQSNKKTLKQGSCATHMTHFKRTAVNPDVNSVNQIVFLLKHNSATSHSPQQPHASLSSPPRLFSQQTQTGESLGEQAEWTAATHCTWPASLFVTYIQWPIFNSHPTTILTTQIH